MEEKHFFGVKYIRAFIKQSLLYKISLFTFLPPYLKQQKDTFWTKNLIIALNSSFEEFFLNVLMIKV